MDTCAPFGNLKQLKCYTLWVITYVWLLGFVFLAQQEPVLDKVHQMHGLLDKPPSETRPLKQEYDLPTVLVVSGAMLTPDYKGGDARILTVIRSCTPGRRRWRMS